MGLGPTFLFPTATKDAFGREQFGIGPTGIFGYKNKQFIAAVFPQYFFKVGSIGDQADKPDASYGQLLYFLYWNVPVGLLVTKTTAVGKRPVKFQFGFEYSVVSQNDFGKRFPIKFSVIPVIQALVQNPIFGGN